MNGVVFNILKILKNSSTFPSFITFCCGSVSIFLLVLLILASFGFFFANLSFFLLFQLFFCLFNNFLLFNYFYAY